MKDKIKNLRGKLEDKNEPYVNSRTEKIQKPIIKNARDSFNRLEKTQETCYNRRQVQVKNIQNEAWKVRQLEKIPRKQAEIKSEDVKAKYIPKLRKDIKPQTEERLQKNTISYTHHHT